MQLQFNLTNVYYNINVDTANYCLPKFFVHQFEFIMSINNKSGNNCMQIF